MKTISEINKVISKTIPDTGLFRIMNDLADDGVITISKIAGNKYKITGIGKNGTGKVMTEQRIGKNNVPYTAYLFNDVFANALINSYIGG